MKHTLHKKVSLPCVIFTLLGMVWLALFPLWQDGSFAHITRGKYIGMLLLCGVTAVAGLTTLIVLARRKKLPEHLRLHPVQLLMLGYFAWVALSAFLGSWHHQLNANGDLTVWAGARRYEGLSTQLCYLSIFLVMSTVRPRLQWLLRAMAVTLILFFTVTILQYAGENPLNLFPEGLSTRTNYEFQGTIGNIDMISGYLCLAVPMLLGGFILQDKPEPLLLFAGLLGVMDQWMIEVQSGIIALAGLMGLMAFPLLMKPERRWRIMLVYGGVLIALAIRTLLGFPWLEQTQDIVFPYQPTCIKFLIMGLGAALMLLAIPVRKHPGKEVSGKVTCIAAIGVILLALVLLMTLPWPEGTGPWEMQQLAAGHWDDDFGSYRMGVWRRTMIFIRNNPIFGTGPDTYYHVMKDYLYRTGERLVMSFDNPHNEYLAIMSNNGIPALILYLAAMGTLIAASLRRRKAENTILLWALCCYLVQAFFSFSICLVAPMFWAVCGMACSWVARTADDISSAKAQL